MAINLEPEASLLLGFNRTALAFNFMGVVFTIFITSENIFNAERRDVAPAAKYRDDLQPQQSVGRSP